VSLGVLALQRARKQLEAFCAQRSGPTSVLTCRPEGGDSLLLQHNGRALVRMQLDGVQWRVFWHRDDAQWVAWPHLPVCDEFAQVIEELEQAPLHVHWTE